jgi:hypothetical protein
VNEMQELLLRWGRLEPERCKYDVNHFLIELEGFKHRVFTKVSPAEAIIQAAVQEAVTAGRWGYEVGNVFRPDSGDAPAITGGADAIVHVSHDGDYSDEWYGRGGSNAAEALLSAYLAALEGT